MFLGVLVLISIVLAIYVPHTEFDFLQILLFVVIIIMLNLGVQLPDSLNKLDVMVLPMYIWQVVAIRIITLTGSPDFLRIPAVLFIDCVISYCWVKILKYFNNKRKE